MSSCIGDTLSAIVTDTFVDLDMTFESVATEIRIYKIQIRSDEEDTTRTFSLSFL